MPALIPRLYNKFWKLIDLFESEMKWFCIWPCGDRIRSEKNIHSSSGFLRYLVKVKWSDQFLKLKWKFFCVLKYLLQLTGSCMTLDKMLRAKTKIVSFLNNSRLFFQTKFSKTFLKIKFRIIFTRGHHIYIVSVSHC